MAIQESTDRAAWSAAFQRATWGCAPAIGRALGLSARAVQQWGQTETDKRSPGERMEILMRVALEERPAHDALAPLHLLAGQLGYRLVPAEDESAGPEPLDGLARQASRAMIEAGQAVQTALEALEDDVLSNDEIDAIERECDEAIEALVRLKQGAKRGG